MLKKLIYAWCLLGSTFTIIHSHSAQQHVSSYPYIAGNTFRQFCDFVIDDSQPFDPALIKKTNTIFVQADLLPLFFEKYHPYIKEAYILVSHNCGAYADSPMPGPFKKYLDDEKLIAWFTQNVDCSHPKLHALPIGLANRIYAHGNIDIFNKCIQLYKKNKRNKLLYLNFDIGTNPRERSMVYNLFAPQKFCSVAKRKELESYLLDLSRHKFTLSPRGNGLDCHRTWEALLMGSIPVVKSSTLDVLFENLPVLIVDDWHEVTPDFLKKKYAEFKKREYKLEKLYAQYWFNKIQQCQAENS